jgi:hypothetical protein
MTSQFFANVYLNGLDHFIKRHLRCRGYIRYVDDMLLFANSKDELHTWRHEVIHYLSKLRLKAHENRAQPRPCTIGVPFLGFQVFPNHRRLKKRNALQARRRLKTLVRQYQQGEIALERVSASIQSWVNHASYGDTWALRRSIFDGLPIPFQEENDIDVPAIPHLQ